MASFHGTEILLIEDAADLAMQIRMVLESNGAKVQIERTAKSGLVAALECYPHLIVCDLGLAGAGGFQFLAELKKNRGLSRIPVLTLTTGIDKTAIMRAMSTGAVACLLKPVQAPQLIQRLERLLTQSPFGRVKFDSNSRPPVKVTVPMEIIRVGECGFTVEAPVMLGPEEEVRLESPLIAQLDCAEVVTRSTDEAVRPAEGNGFANEINLLGVTPKTARTIRGFLRTKALEGDGS